MANSQGKWFGDFSNTSIEQSGKGDRSQKRIVEEIMKYIQPSSVVDFGCGGGLLLKEFFLKGVDDLIGLDLDDIPITNRKIEPEQFIGVDLQKPVNLNRKFDLATSVEVAEHLDGGAAQTFVESITRHADTVVFSAALPYQGGVGHINENWIEYWANLFAAQGFVCFDPFRSVLWNDQSVRYYYRQSLLLFARKGTESRFVNQGLEITNNPYTLIHPELYIKAVNRPRPFDEKNTDTDLKQYYATVNNVNDHNEVYRYGTEELGYQHIKKKIQLGYQYIKKKLQ